MSQFEENFQENFTVYSVQVWARGFTLYFSLVQHYDTSTHDVFDSFSFLMIFFYVKVSSASNPSNALINSLNHLYSIHLTASMCFWYCKNLQLQITRSDIIQWDMHGFCNPSTAYPLLLIHYRWSTIIS